ncbi:MAG TPA: hypothetical protein PL188_05795 [Candidatus Cloacimonadota bacterium]|nr:hypothetical protein [Candidatus Cloacimonadota bacterium]
MDSPLRGQRMSFFTTEKAEKAEGIERIPLADIPGGQVLRRSGWAVWNLLKEAESSRGCPPFSTEKAEKKRELSAGWRLND